MRNSSGKQLQTIMIEQTLIPKDKTINVSFEIPKKFIGKSLKIYIDYEKEEDAAVQKEMTSGEFEQWIENAEDSPNMTLEVFTKKWEQKKAQLKSLIP